MNQRIFVGNTPVPAMAADDRGFAYGDGLFETMRAHHGTLPWWDAHWARLREGSRRLRLALPAETQVRVEAGALLDGGNGVVKLVVSRGSGGRGYPPPSGLPPTWTLSTHALPADSPREGLALRWCTMRLAVQPALAGIKHCNRLEQVLARAEWSDLHDQDRDADEGLMRSTEGDVVCATAANLFILRDGRWATPRVDHCGVAGVCRAWAIQRLQAEQSRLHDADIETADAVFLCNAVRGILGVARLGTRTWSPHPQLAAVQRDLAASHPAFAIDTEVS